MSYVFIVFISRNLNMPTINKGVFKTNSIIIFLNKGRQLLLCLRIKYISLSDLQIRDSIQFILE